MSLSGVANLNEDNVGGGSHGRGSRENTLILFTPGPLSPWGKKTETRHDPGLPSPGVHRGSLSMIGIGCQAFCREWSRASRGRAEIAVRPVRVERLSSPGWNTGLSPRERAVSSLWIPGVQPTMWGAYQAFLGRIVLGMRGVHDLGPSFQFTGRCTRSR